MVVLLFGFSRTAVTVASGALPGDALYPVKRLAEQTRLVLTADTEQRGQLQKHFDQTRREEAQQVAAQGRQVLVQLPGVIASIEGDAWTIFGLDRSVVVPNEVILQGSPGVGKRVLILAWSDGQGNLVAHQITILEDVPHRKQLADTPLPPMDTATPFRGVIPIRPTRVRPTPTDPPRPIRTVTPVVTAAAVFTPSVTSSPVASITPLATSIATPPLTPEPPTLTPVLTSTPALPPSETPTSVPEPAFTSTATPEPSPATPEPSPATPEPATPTPEPPTPEPPTSTPVPPTPEPPTSTPVPPTSTPESPTPTSEPPTSTSEPYRPLAGQAKSEPDAGSWPESCVLRRYAVTQFVCLTGRYLYSFVADN